MYPAEREALRALLARMQDLHRELSGLHAGICLLHLEAAVAALESHMLRNGIPVTDSMRRELTSSAALH